MATTAGVILKINNVSGAWYFDGSGPLRFIPSGHGMGTWLQSIGWPLEYMVQATLDELLENFGEGDAFV